MLNRRRRSREEPRAFEDVLSAHLDSLYGTALRLCSGERPDAEDLLQDAMLRAFEKYSELRDGRAARAWLFTVLLRTHLNRVRAHRRRRETFSGDMTPEAFEEALAEWTPMKTPIEWLDRTVLTDRLAAALDELPKELRATVWLADVEGFTQREVAGMLDVPEGTVASRLFRARRALREKLETSGVSGRRYEAGI